MRRDSHEQFLASQRKETNIGKELAQETLALLESAFPIFLSKKKQKPRYKYDHQTGYFRKIL